LDKALLRETAKVIIGEQLGRQWCPGEEKCAKYASSRDKETVCEGCPKNLSKTSLDKIEGHRAALPWLGHLLYLDALRRVGANFMLDDLTKSEWDGLILIEDVRSEIEQEQYRKQEQKTKLAKALAKQSQVKR